MKFLCERKRKWILYHTPSELNFLRRSFKLVKEETNPLFSSI